MAYDVLVPPGYSQTQIQSLFQGNAVNVFSYIPTELQADIAAQNSFVDVTQYLTNAHMDAGNGGKVYYPPGNYLCQNVPYLAGQSISGAGHFATKIQQIGNNHCLVPYNWINNIPQLYGPQGELTGIQFVASPTSTGGHGFIAWTIRMNFFQNFFNGIGVFCPVHTQNGTIITNITGSKANQAGHRFLTNIFSACPLGAISCGSTDAVTDTYLIGNIFTKCGTQTADGTVQIPTLAVPNYSGWIITANKFEGSQGAYIDSATGDGFDDTVDQSVQIVGNLFDWKCTNPMTSVVNQCIRITPNASGRISIVSNVFKGPRNQPIGATASYNYITINDSGTLAGQSSVGGNIFDIKGGYTGTINAVYIVNPANTPGTCFDNVYDVNFGVTNRGNGDVVWGPHMALFSAVPTGTAQPGQYGFYNNTLYIGTAAGSWLAYGSGGGTGGATAIPVLTSEPLTAQIPANGAVIYVDNITGSATLHKVIIKKYDGTKTAITP